jgi:hypothetical protein
MAEADKAGRRLGLEGVRQLRGEVGKLETDWKNATREVANLAGQLAGQATGQSGLLPELDQEYQALRQAAARRQNCPASAVRLATSQGRRPGPGRRIRALKQQADAARLASKESRQLMQAKRQQRDAARQTMDAEQALTRAPTRRATRPARPSGHSRTSAAPCTTPATASTALPW